MATAYHMEALRRQRVLERAAEARERMQETELASTREEEEKREKEKRKQHRHYHHKRSNRPASAQKISSSPKKSKTAHSPSPPESKKADKMETSPIPPQGDKSSRSSTASKSVNGLQSSGSLHSSNKPGCHSNSTTAPTAEQSRACSSNGEAVSGTETIIVSRCSKCRSVVSSTSSQPHVQGQQSRSASNRSSAVGGGRARSAKSATSVRSGSTRVSSTLASERGRSLEKIVELKADAVRKDLHQQELLLRDSNLVMGNIPVDEEMKLRALEQQKLDLTA